MIEFSDYCTDSRENNTGKTEKAPPQKRFWKDPMQETQSEALIRNLPLKAMYLRRKETDKETKKNICF